MILLLDFRYPLDHYFDELLANILIRACFLPRCLGASKIRFLVAYNLQKDINKSGKEYTSNTSNLPLNICSCSQAY